MMEKTLNFFRLNKVVMRMILFIVLTTTCYLPFVGGIRANRWLVFGVTGILTCALASFKKDKFAGMFIGYVAVIFYFSYTINIFEPLYSVLCVSIMFCMMVYSYSQWKKYKNTLYNAICGIALLNVVFTIMQQFGIYILLKPVECSIPIGLMSNPNELSALLAICLPFFFRRKWLWFVPILCAGLYLSQSTNGILASLITISIYLIIIFRHRYRIVIAGIVFAMMLFGLYVTYIDTNHVVSLQSRLTIWGKSIKASSVKPFGWGFGQYEYVIPLISNPKSLSNEETTMFLASIPDKKALERVIVKITGSTDYNGAHEYFSNQKNNIGANFMQAHNEYVELYFIGGLIAIILGILFLGKNIIKGLFQSDKIPVLSLIASASTAIFFFTWQIVPTMVLTIFVLSAIIGENNNEAEPIDCN